LQRLFAASVPPLTSTSTEYAQQLFSQYSAFLSRLSLYLRRNLASVRHWHEIQSKTGLNL
jgi:hypothetical protein